MKRDPETELRAIWTAQGVPQARQDAMIAEIVRKAQPEYLAGMFPSDPTPAGEQLLIPGCEGRQTQANKPAQPSLWDAANERGR